MKWFVGLIIVALLSVGGYFGHQKLIVEPNANIEKARVVLEAWCVVHNHKGFKALEGKPYCVRQDDSLEEIKEAMGGKLSGPSATATVVPPAPPPDPMSNTGIVESARAKWDAKCKGQGGRVSMVQEQRKNKAYCLMPSGQMNLLGVEDK